MDIATVALYRYDLPLEPPLQMGDFTLERRRGLLVRLEAETGAVGWGDAAPLPSFSSETLSDVVVHARSEAPQWVGTSLPGADDDFGQSLRALSSGTDGPPSLQFAMESAFVSLVAAMRGASLPAVLGAPRSTVALNALITRPENEGAAQAARYRTQGYRAVKVKGGRASVREEAEWLRAIRQALGERMALRVDANRAWTLSEGIAFAEATRDLDISYVEEPLADRAYLGELTAKTDLSIALDETTREVGPSVLSDEFPVSAVVLKPTLLGGLQTTLQWYRAARDNNVTPVLSAAYESGVGLRMLVALAAVGPDTPVGLSTYDRLGDDVISPLRLLEGPTVEVASVVGATGSLDEAQLRLVDSFSS